MSDMKEPASFSLLSQELQDMIWSYSLSPQMITLYYNDPSDPHKANESDLFFSVPDAPLKSYIAPTPGQLEPINTQALVAFSICRASRAIAQSQGYKTWRFTRSDGTVREILWKPSMDTIYFTTIHRRHFDSFVKYFSTKIGDIQKLALPYSFWDACYRTKTSDDDKTRHRRGSRGMATLLTTPCSVRKMFVIVDQDFFASKVLGKSEDQLDFWIAPWGIGK